MEGPVDSSARPERLETWATRVAAVVVSFLAGLLTLRRFGDLDVLWHVRTGEWILEQRAVPFEDPFGAFTIGLPWIDVAWGAQIVMAMVTGLFGLTGVHFVAAVVVAVTLRILLGRASSSALVITAGLAFVLVVWFRFLPRPDLLTLPLTAVLMFLVDRLPRKPVSTCALLTVLTLAWANVHGSFVLVPVVLGAAAVGSIPVRSTRRRLPAYAAAFGLSLAAPLVNPYGVHLYRLFVPYVRSVLAVLGAASPEERLDIAEWKPTWQVMTEAAYSPTLLILLVILLVASFTVGGRRLSMPLLSSMIALAVLGLLAVRNLLPFAVAALAAVTINERDRLADKSDERRSRAVRFLDSHLCRRVASSLVVIVGTMSVLSVLTDRFYVSRDLPYRTGVALDPDLAPDGAARWLAEHEYPGAVFNNFDSGSYLLYSLAPDYRPYDDARVVDPRHFRQTRLAVSDPAAFDGLVARDAVGTIVLVHPSPESVVLAPRLARDPRWTLAFRDHNSTVHVRADLPPPAPRSPAGPYRPIDAGLAPFINDGFDRFKMYRLPVRELSDAFVSAVLGDREREHESYLRAHEIAPESRRVREYFGTRDKAGSTD